MVLSKLEKAYGSNAVAFFCVFDVFIFIVCAYFIVIYLETDPRAVDLGGTPLPKDQWSATQTAFMTSLILDFISWLWTVHKDKTRLFYLAFVINGVPVLTYKLLASGLAPILMDAHGASRLCAV